MDMRLNQPSPRLAASLRREQYHATFPLRSRVIFGVVLTAVLVGGCGVWAATSKLSGAVIAQGQLRVDEHVKVVQHRDGGIVTAINVRAGDMVTEGQVLISLDAVQASAELSIVRSQLAELRGRQARLMAIVAGADEISFPSDFHSSAPDAVGIAQGEISLFLGDLGNRQRLQSQLRLQSDQLGQEMTGITAQRDALLTEIDLVQAELDKVDALARGGLVEGSRVYTIRRDLTRMLGQRGELEASMARAAVKASEIALEIMGVDQAAATDAQRELRSVDATISELTERRIAIEDRLMRVDIRAPITGIVNELNVHTVGGVVAPGETLAMVVPEGASLRVEFRMRTIDIDQISVGQSAKLRFSAFNQRTTPEVDGKVVRVSAAAQHDSRTGETFYIGEAEITGDMDAIGRQNLLPGMPVEVFLETQEMTAMSYLVKPFSDQMARALREE